MYCARYKLICSGNPAGNRARAAVFTQRGTVNKQQNEANRCAARHEFYYKIKTRNRNIVISTAAAKNARAGWVVQRLARRGGVRRGEARRGEAR